MPLGELSQWALNLKWNLKKKQNKQTEREQKAWVMIRTATGVVAKLISQKEIGR